MQTIDYGGHIMNPRRLHVLFSKHWPQLDLASREWTHVMRNGSAERRLLEQFVLTIGAEHLLVHVHRKLGDFLPHPEAMEFVCEHMGKSNIRITDRHFKRFVVVGQNGVVAAWA